MNTEENVQDVFRDLDETANIVPRDALAKSAAVGVAKNMIDELGLALSDDSTISSPKKKTNLPSSPVAPSPTSLNEESCEKVVKSKKRRRSSTKDEDDSSKDKEKKKSKLDQDSSLSISPTSSKKKKKDKKKKKEKKAKDKKPPKRRKRSFGHFTSEMAAKNTISFVHKSMLEEDSS